MTAILHLTFSMSPFVSARKTWTIWRLEPNIVTWWKMGWRDWEGGEGWGAGHEVSIHSTS